MKLEFETPPTLGTVLTDGSQSFELVQVEPYTRKDGVASWLLVWKGPCLKCGETFEVTTGLKTRGMNRRCPAHRHPGRPSRGAGTFVAIGRLAQGKAAEGSGGE